MELPQPLVKTGLAEQASNSAAAAKILEKVLGGPEKTIMGADGMGVLISAEVLSRRQPERSPFYPFLQDMIEDPYEIWMTLDRHNATGRVELRKRYIKLLHIGKEKQAMCLVAQVVKGQLVAWTLVTSSNPSGLNKQRVGKLLYFRK